MDVKTLIQNRRSVRQFKPEKVPIQIIKEMLDVARWAPSACNIQGWRFLIINDERIKNKIFDHGGSILIKRSPTSVLFLYDNRTDNEEYADYIQSSSAAIQNFLLYASSKEIGTCWINHLPNKKTLIEILKLPKYYEPIALVVLGYPLKDTFLEIKRKYDIEKIVSLDNQRFESETLEVRKIATRKIFRKIYYNLPLPIKKRLNNYLDKKYVKKFEN